MGAVHAMRRMPTARDRWRLGLLAGTIFAAGRDRGNGQARDGGSDRNPPSSLIERAISKPCGRRMQQAIRLDPWFALDIPTRQRIGAIDQNFGRTETVDAGVYRIEALVQQADYLSAIAEIEKLLRKAGADGPMLRQRAGALWALQGRKLYGAGAIGDAALAWQNALLYDPNQLYAGFCLSSAYYDLGRYTDCIALSSTLQKTIEDPYMLSQLLSNQGDAYTKLGELSKARLAYEASFKMDNVINWRGLSALVGSN